MSDKSVALIRSRPSKPATARAELEFDVRKKLRILYSSAKLQSREISERCGVSAGQLWALSELGTQPGMSVSELAKRLFIKNSTASNLLDRLERRGWVRRERNGKDQRVVQLQLTSEGSELVARCPVPPRGVVTEALRLIPLDSLEALDKSLDEVIARLRVRDEDAGLTPLADI